MASYQSADSVVAAAESKRRKRRGSSPPKKRRKPSPAPTVGYTPITTEAKRNVRQAAKSARVQTRAIATTSQKQSIRRAENVINRALNPERSKKRLARRKVINAVTIKGGTYVNPRLPTQENIREAWETFNREERERVAKKLISRFNDPGDKKRASTRKHTLPRFLRKYDPEGFDTATGGIKAAVRKAENAADMNASDLSRAIEVGTLAIPVGGVVKAVQYGTKGIQAARAARAARAIEEAATTSKGVRAATTGAKVGTTGGRAGKAAEGVRSARSTIRGSKVGQAAARAGATKGGKAVKVGGKVGAYPIRHPLKATGFYAGGSAALAVPAAIKDKSLDPVADALMGAGGLVVDAKNKLGEGLDHLGIVGNAARDILEIPAAAIPSTYLLGDALIKYAQGNEDPLKEQINGFIDEGLLPGIAKGDWDQVATALTEHPVFSGLELGGAYSVAGRGAGAAMRSGALGEGAKARASTDREALSLGEDLDPLERGRYSRNVVTKAAQVALERRRERREGEGATAKQVHKALNERTDRLRGGNEGARRVVREVEKQDAESARPKSEVDADAVTLAVRGILRGSRSFKQDIEGFATKIDAAFARMKDELENGNLTENEKGSLRVRMEANRRNAEKLVAIAREGDPEVIFASRDANVPALRSIDADLKRVGLLDEAQGEKAALTASARAHLDTGYGIPEDLKAQHDRYRELQAQHKKTAGRLEEALDRGDMPRIKELRAQYKAETEALKDKPAPLREQMTDREGNAVPLARLKEMLQEVGVDEENVGFVTNRPYQTERAANYVPQNERPSLPKGALTGESVDEGTFDMSYDSIVNHRVRARGVVSAADSFDSDIRAFKIGRNFDDAKTAKAAVENPENYEIVAPKGQKLRVVRASPMMAKLRELETAEELQAKHPENVVPAEDLSRADSQDMAEAWAQATKNISDDDKGPFVLIPETAFMRLNEHFTAASPGMKATQMANQAFKSTVLATSPKWLAGNIIDPNLRTILSGNLPFGGVSSVPGVKNSGYGNLAQQAMQRAHEKDPITAARHEAIIAHGQHLGSQLETRIERRVEDFDPNTTIGKVMRVGQKIPGGTQVHAAWKGIYENVFKANQKFIEDPVTRQLLGKAMVKELLPELGPAGRMKAGMKIADEIVDDLAEGILDPAKAIRLAKVVEETTGQWSGNSPRARYLLSTYMPFGMWTRAATTYVLYTLPAKHPIKMSILSATEQMTQDEREALGLSLFSDRPAPDSMRGAIPTPSGGIQPFANYSTFGYFGDLPGGLQASVLPQVNGSLMALAGMDPFGNPLTNDDDTPVDPLGRFSAAATQLAGGFAPFYSRYKSVEDADSTGEGILKQIPFTNANVIESDLYENYFRNLSQMQTIQVPAEGSDTGESSGSSYSVPSTSGGLGGSYSGAASSGGLAGGYNP